MRRMEMDGFACLFHGFSPLGEKVDALRQEKVSERWVFAEI